MTDTLSNKLGVQQGQLQPAGFAPLDGSYAFVLGSDAPGALEYLTPGDHATLTQEDADLTGGTLLYLFGMLRVPSSTPEGYSWRVTFTVDGGSTVVAELAGVAIPGGDSFLLVDAAANISKLEYGNIEIKLELMGPGADAVLLELPALYLDVLSLAEPGELALINRVPAPSQTQVAIDLGELALTLAPLDGTDVDQTSINVTVQGTAVMTAGVFETGFAGTLTSAVGASSVDVVLVFDVSSLTFESEEVVEVEVEAATVGDGVLSETYSFAIQDLTLPTLVSATATSPLEIAVVFSEPVGASALDTAAYVITRVSSPAVALTVISVAAGDDASSVVLTTDFEHSFGKTYLLTVNDVADLFGNVIEAPDNAVEFLGYQPQTPAGRSFLLWELLAQVHRTSDVTGDLKKLCDVLQDTLDLVLYLVDRWVDILDPDLASSPFVSVMLKCLGNPFPFDLDLADMRLLISVLIPIYQGKGTNVGVVDAVFFFLGFEIEITPLNDFEGGWVLGEGLLGEDSLLFTEASYTLYSFDVTIPLPLTDAEREAMLTIIDYMKPGHEHIANLFEPPYPEPDQFWILGEGELGESTELQITI